MIRFRNSMVGCVLMAAVMLSSSSVHAADITTSKLRETVTAVRDELEWPGHNLAVAAANLKTPKAAFEFVRDGVLLMDYPGAIAGAEGALRMRAANAVDKALLLQALLEAQTGVETRLVQARWLQAKPHRGVRSAGESTALNELIRQHSPEGEVSSPSRINIEPLQQEVEASLELVTGLLQQSGLKMTSVEREPVSREWVWVQAKLDGEWKDFDPVFPDKPHPQAIQKPYVAASATVTITIEALQADGKTAAILDWSARTSELIGFDATISMYPDQKKTDWLTDMSAVEKAAQWKATLQVGTTTIVSRPFNPENGKLAKKPGGGFGGFGGGLFGSKPGTPAAPGAIQLNLKVVVRQSDREWTMRRVLHNLKMGFDKHELVAVHRIGILAGGVPDRVVMARAFDELLDFVAYRELIAGGRVPRTLSGQRGLSTRSARIANTMIAGLAAVAWPEAGIEWQGPGIFLETSQLQKDGRDVFCQTRLDVLQHSFVPAATASARDRIRWGLATCALEGMLLKSDSVNQLILQSNGVETSQEPDPNSPAADLLKAGGISIASTNRPNVVWTVGPDGTLKGIFKSDAVVASKGATRREKTETAAKAWGALGSASLAGFGAPSGMLVTVLQKYFEELARAYGVAASRLSLVAGAIESGDASKLNQSQDDYFKELAKRLLGALKRGAARGYLESVAGGLMGYYFVAQPDIDRSVLNAVTAAGLSASDTLPGEHLVNQLVGSISR